MERKKKKKMKIKKRTKERKEGFPIKDRKEVKREKRQFSVNERKRTKDLQTRYIFSKVRDCRQRKTHFWCLFPSDFHSRSFSTGDIPPHLNKEEKTETPSFLSKNTTLEKILLVCDRTFDL